MNNMATQIFKSYDDFKNRHNRLVNGVSEDFAAANPDYENHNTTNVGCWNCLNCLNCNNCLNCKDCYYCNDCKDCNDCNDCKDCYNCNNCKDCYYCRGAC